MNKQTWITSDLHFGHANILKFCAETRKCSTVEEMNDTLVKNWNSRVATKDIIYILGDVSFMKPEPTAEIISRLNGVKHLVRGNHDRGLDTKLFESSQDYLEVKYDGMNFCMSHYPFLVWNRSHYGSVMLHGHSHGSITYPFEGRIMDVGIDTRSDMSPYNMSEIVDIMRNKSYHKLDQH